MNQTASELYTVPQGITVHCHVCSVVLESGTQCYIEHEDSSAILCKKCAAKRHTPAHVGPTEQKENQARRAHRRAEWMDFD